MKYAVLGAGAVGAGLAASLFLAGQDIVLVDPLQPHTEAIQKNGLKVNWANIPGQEPSILKIKTELTAEGLDKVDVIFVCTKTVHTRSAMENAKMLAHENSVVISYQNGLGNEDIIEEYFPGRSGYAVVYSGGNVPEPGVINSAIAKNIIHMYVTTRNERVVPYLLQFEKDLESVDFTPKYLPVPELGFYLWHKLAYNCAVNATCALANCTMNGLWEIEPGVELCRHIVEECVAVAKKSGVAITEKDIFGSAGGMVPDTPQPRKTGYRHYPSLVNDINNKRKTEIHFLNGAVAREGKRLGVPTPYNDCVSLLLQSYENTFDDNYTVIAL